MMLHGRVKFHTSKISKFEPGGGLLRGTRPAETTDATARKSGRNFEEDNMVSELGRLVEVEKCRACCDVLQ